MKRMLMVLGAAATLLGCADQSRILFYDQSGFDDAYMQPFTARDHFPVEIYGQAFPGVYNPDAILSNLEFPQMLGTVKAVPVDPGQDVLRLVLYFNPHGPGGNEATVCTTPRTIRPGGISTELFVEATLCNGEQPKSVVLAVLPQPSGPRDLVFITGMKTVLRQLLEDRCEGPQDFRQISNIGP